jgi:hypothetical protein
MTGDGVIAGGRRPSLKERAMEQAEIVRKEKGLPRDEEEVSLGPFIKGLDDLYDESDGMPKQKAPPEQKGGISARESNINNAYVRAYEFAANVQRGAGTPDTIERAAAVLLGHYLNPAV